MNRRIRIALALAIVATPLGTMAQATFPSKPVRFIVPYAAGGLPDTVARIVSQKLTERLGQPVVVDNKPGGNGVVAYQSLMNSSDDSHTFIVSDGSMLSITPQLNKAATYKIGKELTPVSLIARSPLFLVAYPKTGVKSLDEFVATVKSNPGRFSYGSSGVGSSHQLTMEAIKSELKLDIQHVPFRGSGQSVPALVGGEVHFLFSALPSMAGFVKNNQVTLIGTNGAKRSPQAPHVAAISEVIPGFDFSVTVGALARNGTSQEAIRRLSSEIAQIVKLPDVVDKFQTAGIEPVGAGPEAYRKEIDRENQAMTKAGKAADLKTE